VRGNGTMMLVFEFPGSNTALIPSYDENDIFGCFLVFFDCEG